MRSECVACDLMCDCVFLRFRYVLRIRYPCRPRSGERTRDGGSSGPSGEVPEDSQFPTGETRVLVTLFSLNTSLQRKRRHALNRYQAREHDYEHEGVVVPKCPILLGNAHLNLAIPLCSLHGVHAFTAQAASSVGDASARGVIFPHGVGPLAG